ncbi:hypothetical protein SARC_07800 [Sphaeroforma arctica JP610]|uniref:Helicase ATP-binding domain-containing protein n=1 Tax=Sphaeroforma arctica JP610 TaxID=667725 RepID=A0A0L0FT10_9EUKA|nr:hypothetical protein SARC_07800 [Sphaeroforma arctica JP610]KNC79819.1 hypothetical protein SARC_07800 [Sphaeroforma arctica JP610]|eukprot:XP_014153721.1 hypothetical protein SARC_07800 [Sphaeroforma arctica JP610]
MMGTSVNHHDAEIELQALKIELVAFESGCLKTLGHRLSKADCSKKHPDMMLKYKRFSKLKMLTNTNATTKSKFQTERGVIKSTSTPPGNVSDTTEVNKSRNTMSTRVVRVKSADTTAKHKVEDKGSHTSGKFGSKLNKKIKDAASYKPKKGRPLNVRGLSFKSSVNLGAVEPESDASIAGQKSVRPQSIEHTTSSNTRKATTMPLPTKGTTSPGAGKSANSLADTSRTLLNEQAHARGQSGTSTSDPSHADSMVGTVEHPVPFKAEQVLLSAMNTVEMMPAYQAHTRQAQRHTQTHACAPTLDSAVRVPGGVRVGVDTTARAENPHTNAVGSVDGGVVVAHGGGGALRSGLTASAPLSFGKTADVRRRSSHFKNVVQNDTKRKAEQAQRQKEREEFAAMFDLHEGQARDGNDAGVYTADGALGTTSGARDLRGKAEVDYMLDGEAVDQSQWTTLGEETDLPIKQAEDASGKDKKPAKSYNIKSAQVSNNFVRMDLKKNFRRGAQGITPAFMANNFNSSDDEAYLGQNGPQMQVHLRTRDTGTSNAVYETQNFNSIKPVTETVEIGLDEVKIPSLAVRDDQAPLRFFDELEPLPQSQSHLAHALDMEGMQDSDTGHRGNRNAAISLDMKGCADIREDGSDGGSVGDEKRSCVDTDEKQNMGSVKGKRTLTDETPREVECSGCLSALDMEGRNLHLKAKGQSSTGLSEDTTYPSIDTKESPIDQAKPAADSTELPNNKRTSRTERASTGEKPIKRVKRISSAGERHESQSCTGEEYENSGTECSTKSTEQSINRPSRGARKGTATTHTDEMASPDTASCRKSVRKNTRTQTSKQANTDSDISSDMDAPKKKGRRVPQASAQDMCTRTRTRSRMKEASPSKPQTSMRVTRARRACVQTTVTETTGTQRRTSWAQDVSGSSGEDRDGGGTDSSSDYGDIDDVDYTCALREGLGDSGDDTEVSSGGASEVGSSSEGTEGKVLKGRVHGRKPQRSNFKSSESDADTDGIGGGGKSTCRSVGGARKGTKGRRKVTTRRQDTAAVNGDVNSSARPTTAAPTKQRKKTLRPEDIQRLAENPAHALKYVYGFDTFRPGQELAVSRICKGQATLVVQPTGSGKSLCYQLPAFIQALESPSLCLVVCPLVSLMHDQVKRLPKAYVDAHGFTYVV